MISSLWFLDNKGKPIIGRNYRGDIPSDSPDLFFLARLEQPDKPIIYYNKLFYHFISIQDIFLVAISKHDPMSATIFTFLKKALAVFQHFIGNNLGEEALRDNFILVYELLDEIMDFGIPQCTDVKILKDLVTQQGIKFELAPKAKSPPPITGVSWRKEGIKYKRNEVFLDVVESVDMSLDSKSQLLGCSVRGKIQMKTRLSGMPELKLGLNDRLMLESSKNLGDLTSTGLGKKGTTEASQMVEMEDFRFHPSVRLDRFQAERVITFVPPDGEFELLSYRINNPRTFSDGQLKALFLVECFIERYSSSILEMRVRMQSQFKKKSSANQVKLEIPVPSDSDSPKLNCTIGGASFRPEKNCIVWSIGHFPGGGKEHQLKIKVGFPTVRNPNPDANMRRPMRLMFEIPYFTMSGVQVRYLKVVETSGYSSLPWVRYITQNGGNQINFYLFILDYFIKMPELIPPAS